MKSKSFILKTSRDKGFTFIEIILYISLVTLIMSALIPYAWNVIEGAAKSSVEQEVYSNATYVSERIKYEIRNAADICQPVQTTTLTLLEAAGASCAVATNTTVISLASNNVMISQNGAAAVQLNSSKTQITSLTFTNYTSGDNKTKHIGFTFTMQALYGGSTRQEYKESISMEGSAELTSN